MTTYACGCGCTFTDAEFSKLTTIGVFGLSGGTLGPWRAVEARRCSHCERPLARHITLPNARRPVDPEATDENPDNLRRAFAGVDADPDEEV